MLMRALGLLLPLSFAAGNFEPGSESSSNVSSPPRGFSVGSFLRDGEFQRITTWPGFCCKETSVDWGDIEVTLREVWLAAEKRKLQLIYEGGTLSDCYDEESDSSAAGVGRDRRVSEQRCLANLRQQSEGRGAKRSEDDGGEATAQGLSPEDFSLRHSTDWFVSADDLRRRCFRVRTRTRNQALARQREQSRARRGILPDFLFAPGTKWCGPTQLASRYNELGAFDGLDRCCRRHDHCHRAIPPMTQRYAFYNSMPFTLSHCGCDQRKYESSLLQATAEDTSTGRRRRRGRGRGRERGRGKRELLLVPGTQWCGRGHRATKYTNLGGFGLADSCCRRHDTTCPFFIPAFQTKYDLFNWGLSTLMHCACDERFRTCLKMAGTSSANFVGKLFFNVVQTKCFVLKPQKTCVQRSWWGKCELHEYRKQAHLRDNVPY